jgi:hypothetical protein
MSQVIPRDTYVLRVVKASVRHGSRLERVHQLSVIHRQQIYATLPTT